MAEQKPRNICEIPINILKMEIARREKEIEALIQVLNDTKVREADLIKENVTLNKIINLYQDYLMPRRENEQFIDYAERRVKEIFRVRQLLGNEAEAPLQLPIPPEGKPVDDVDVDDVMFKAEF